MTEAGKRACSVCAVGVRDPLLAAGEAGRDNFALTLNASVKDGLEGFAPDFVIELEGAPLFSGISFAEA